MGKELACVSVEPVVRGVEDPVGRAGLDQPADRLQPALERAGLGLVRRLSGKVFQPASQFRGRHVPAANFLHERTGLRLTNLDGPLGPLGQAVIGNARQRLGEDLPSLHRQRHGPLPDVAEIQPGVGITRTPQPAGRRRGADRSRLPDLHRPEMRPVRVRIADTLHDRQVAVLPEPVQVLERGVQADPVVQLEDFPRLDPECRPALVVHVVGVRNDGIQSVIAAGQLDARPGSRHPGAAPPPRPPAARGGERLCPARAVHRID